MDVRRQTHVPKPAAKSSQEKQSATALYLYAISEAAKNDATVIAAEGIDGEAPVESIHCEGHLCWISRVPKTEFADTLPDRMQDLEWLATAGLRHQRAVSEISAHVMALPARFGTVFLTEDSLAQHLKERKATLKQSFQRVADADEWGIKVFAARQAEKISRTDGESRQRR